ncbi:MAG TPA: DUF6632 domain-containing protein [Candidatus Sulfotelmatobacter sp.]|nr:DUF6632 domain-containing protein [Candidatus Sulfotelmatobacter sp.]
MARERVLRIVLVVVGVLFCALAYPALMFFSKEPAITMIMSLYVPLGIFLLLAARDPSRHRSLIAYAGWANVAHASVMAVQEYWHVIAQRELVGVAVFGVIGITLIALTPGKQLHGQASAAGAD